MPIQASNAINLLLSGALTHNDEWENMFCVSGGCHPSVLLPLSTHVESNTGGGAKQKAIHCELNPPLHWKLPKREVFVHLGRLLDCDLCFCACAVVIIIVQKVVHVMLCHPPPLCDWLMWVGYLTKTIYCSVCNITVKQTFLHSCE